VRAALEQRAGLEAGLASPRLASLDARDRGFARLLALTTLRRLGSIDARLAVRMKKPPPEAVLQLLRLGLAQALYLDTPAFAAVDTSVRLAERSKTTRSFKGLVNAVLRAVLREPAAEDDPESLAPGWLFARWRAAYGEDAARGIAAMIPAEPATHLSLREAGDAEALAGPLEAEALPGGGLRSRLRGDVAGWPGYAEGRWWVQDAAAAIVPRLLAVRPDEATLDICAAPGGKTLALAAAGARVTALDRSAERLVRLSENLKRTGLAAEVVAAPLETWRDPRRFPAVLLDAPCSATGTFRRHPDVLWVCRPSDVASLAEAQARLLDAAAARVDAGGRLVYSVCSLEPEEGEAQVAGFLERQSGFRLDAIAAGEGGAPEAASRPDGALRILPFHREGGLDGFFVARFRRA